MLNDMTIAFEKHSKPRDSEIVTKVELIFHHPKNKLFQAGRINPLILDQFLSLLFQAHKCSSFR